MDLRIKCAEEQLCLTKKRLNEISPECGFSDPVLFTREFRKKYGVSPRGYRRLRSSLREDDAEPRPECPEQS